MVISVDKQEMYEILLGVLLAALITIYCIYVIIDEREKVKYYNKSFSYETHWDKYSTMVNKQRNIIAKKKLQLYFLKFLVFVKEVFVWKD